MNRKVEIKKLLNKVILSSVIVNVSFIAFVLFFIDSLKGINIISDMLIKCGEFSVFLLAPSVVAVTFLSLLSVKVATILIYREEDKSDKPG